MSLSVTDVKTCRSCGEEKPEGEFGRSRDTWNRCRQCRRAGWCSNPRGKECRGCRETKPFGEFRNSWSSRCDTCAGTISNLDQIHNPIALATKYLASRRLLNGSADDEELMDVAIEAIVDAALSWVPKAGASMTTWAWQYMDHAVSRAIGRLERQRHELGVAECVSVSDGWLCPRHGDPEFDRVEQRVDLQRWADLAELSGYQRFCVEYYANHFRVYVRGTPLAGRRSPLTGSGTVKVAMRHMRDAALTGQRRDDKWTRMRDRSYFEAKSAAAVAFWRNEMNRPLIDRSDCA